MRYSVVLVDTSYPINTRNSKILESLGKTGLFDVNVITWNRTGEVIKEDINAKTNKRIGILQFFTNILFVIVFFTIPKLFTFSQSFILLYHFISDV